MEDALAIGATRTDRDPRERIGELFDRHHARLLRLASRMAWGQDEALDLVQETFLRAAKRPGAVPEDDDGAEAWLVRVLVNICRDRYRRQRVRSAYETTADARMHDRAFEAAVVASLTVRRILMALPPRQRAVVAMHYFEDLSAPAIARRLGVTSVTVRWHLAAARKALAGMLREEARDA